MTNTEPYNIGRLVPESLVEDWQKHFAASFNGLDLDLNPSIGLRYVYGNDALALSSQAKLNMLSRDPSNFVYQQVGKEVLSHEVLLEHDSSVATAEVDFLERYRQHRLVVKVLDQPSDFYPSGFKLAGEKTAIRKLLGFKVRKFSSLPVNPLHIIKIGLIRNLTADPDSDELNEFRNRILGVVPLSSVQVFAASERQI